MSLLLGYFVVVEVSFLAVASLEIVRPFGHGDPLSRLRRANAK